MGQRKLERVLCMTSSLRPEVLAFMRTAETLLSPASLGKGLTEEEREIIATYGNTLAEKFSTPASESWPEHQS